MNTLVIVLIAAVVLVCAYAGYGRWLAKTWGVDPNAKTPAVRLEDGKDYVPTKGWTVFAHQFSSIAGAGPVTGAIQAAAFGWLPVLLWVLIGGVFFGAVTDFGALYASVKNDGKSMGLLIEKYIGKTGRKLFLLFCWLFCGIVIAAFADMVAGTFNAFDADGAQVEAAFTNGAAGMVSIMFMVFAVVFGFIQKKFNFSGWREAVIGIIFIILSFAIGMNCPLVFGKTAWSYITFVYIFFAAVLPMWMLKQPRDYMTTFMFGAMIAGAVIGLLVAHPTMNLPVFTGFNNAKLGTMFPILFVTVACGAVSGFHSLVSSGTSSKTVENEKDMLKVGYGAMVLESLLAVLALCVAGAAAAAHVVGGLARDGAAAEQIPQTAAFLAAGDAVDKGPPVHQRGRHRRPRPAAGGGAVHRGVVPAVVEEVQRPLPVDGPGVVEQPHGHVVPRRLRRPQQPDGVLPHGIGAVLPHLIDIPGGITGGGQQRGAQHRRQQTAQQPQPCFPVSAHVSSSCPA